MRFPKLYRNSLLREKNLLIGRRMSVLGNREAEFDLYVLRALDEELKQLDKEYVIDNENS